GTPSGKPRPPISSATPTPSRSTQPQGAGAPVHQREGAGPLCRLREALPSQGSVTRTPKGAIACQGSRAASAGIASIDCSTSDAFAPLRAPAQCTVHRYAFSIQNSLGSCLASARNCGVIRVRANDSLSVSCAGSGVNWLSIGLFGGGFGASRTLAKDEL